MSTGILEVAARMVGIDSQGIRAYKESVFSGEIDEGILFDARRIAAEWRADRSTFERRLHAVDMLQVELPRLQAAAAEVAKALAEAEAFAKSPLPDNATVAELRARLYAAAPKAKSGLPGELAAGLAYLADHMPSGRVGNLKSAALEARHAVDACRSRAEQALRDTCAEQGQDPAVVAIGHRITEIQTRIASRSEVLEAESRAAALREECEQLARGNRPVDVPAFGQQRTSSGMLYKRARQRLDQLLDLVAGKADAEKADQRDHDELARLRVKSSEVREAALRRLCDPKAMKWVE